jgi:hypothetical protein
LTAGSASSELAAAVPVVAVPVRAEDAIVDAGVPCEEANCLTRLSVRRASADDAPLVPSRIISGSALNASAARLSTTANAPTSTIVIRARAPKTVARRIRYSFRVEHLLAHPFRRRDKFKGPCPYEGNDGRPEPFLP